MVRRLGSLYVKHRSSPSRNKILMHELKKILSTEVEALLRLNGMLRPPFDPFKITRIGNVPIRVEFESAGRIGSNGKLEVIGNEFVVELDRNLREEKRQIYRLRSTMAHELMHTFFYDTSKLPPEKLGHGSKTRKDLLMEEEICYYLSRQFLMPTFSLRNLLNRNNYLRAPSIRNIKYLKSSYEVSSDLIAYRLVNDLDLWDTIFIKFVQTGTGYRSITKLKAKSNNFYERIKIPSTIPTKFSDSARRLIVDQVLRTQVGGYLRTSYKLNEHNVIVESDFDSADPVSVIMLLHAANSKNLEDFL